MTPRIRLPEECVFLHGLFREISATRGWENGFPKRISNTELLAWLQLSGHVLSRQEIAVLKQVDEAYVSAVSEEREAQMEREKNNNG